MVNLPATDIALLISGGLSGSPGLGRALLTSLCSQNRNHVQFVKTLTDGALIGVGSGYL